MQPCDDAGHAEQRQPRPQRSPLGAGIRREVGPGGNIRREEEALENVEVPLVPVIKKSVPAAGRIVHPGILQDCQHRRHQQHTGHTHAQHCFQRQQQKVLQGDFPAARKHPHKPVDDAEGYLSHKEIVVHQTAGEDRQGEHASAPGFHIFVHGRQQQGKEDNGFVEVVEKHVVHGKAGKRIEQTADDGPVFPADIPPQVNKAGQGRKSEFQHEQRGHQIGHRFTGKQQRQPEKGASQQIEGIGADEVCSQIRGPAPSGVARKDGVMAHLIKGHLLYVKVPVIEEMAVVHNEKGQEHQKGQSQPIAEGSQILVGTPAQQPPVHFFAQGFQNLRLLSARE